MFIGARCLLDSLEHLSSLVNIDFLCESHVSLEYLSFVCHLLFEGYSCSDDGLFKDSFLEDSFEFAETNHGIVLEGANLCLKGLLCFVPV